MKKNNKSKYIPIKRAANIIKIGIVIWAVLMTLIMISMLCEIQITPFFSYYVLMELARTATFLLALNIGAALYIDYIYKKKNGIKN